MRKIICILLSALMMLTLISGMTLSTAAAEDLVDVSENYHSELPPRFDTEIDCFELEDLFEEDGSGFNRNTLGTFDYYFLKGEYGKTYMTVKFNVEESGTYELCIALMALGSSVPRSSEWSVNGGQRFYVSRLYQGMSTSVGEAEYIDGMTVYLRKGENYITFYSGHDFDNVNVKSVFIDAVYYARTGALPEGYKFPDEGKEEEKVDITGATPDRVKFNENFKSLITSSIFCSSSYVEDTEKGNVMKLTVTESVDVPRFAFSYNKYMKLLGLDPETETCGKYNYMVLCLKADAGIASGTSDMFAFTDGNTVINESQRYCEFFDTDSGWQYIIYDMESESYWSGKYDGGYFLIGGTGCEVGSAIYVSELALFETYNQAAAFAGLAAEVTTSEETTEEEASTASETSVSEATTEASVNQTEAVTDTVTTQTQNGKNSGGCGASVSFLAAIAMLGTAFTAIKKKQ